VPEHPSDLALALALCIQSIQIYKVYKYTNIQSIQIYKYTKYTNIQKSESTAWLLKVPEQPSDKAKPEKTKSSYLLSRAGKSSRLRAN
jgi:hypothetical protein